MQTVYNIVLVGLGGFCGSVLRYLVSGWAHTLFKADMFPLGTAVVNIAGCLVIGILGGLTDQLQTLSPHTRLFLLLGLLGGFTTFSSFGYETVALLRDRELLLAFVNVAVNVVLGFGAVLVGFNCTKLW